LPDHSMGCSYSKAGHLAARDIRRAVSPPSLKSATSPATFEIAPTLWDQHPDTLDSICKLSQLLSASLGSLLQDHGDFDGAEPLLRKALEDRRETLGDRHRDTLTSIHNLGTLLQNKGDLDKAEPLLRKALEGYRETLGDRHRDTLTLINSLGTLLQDKGDLDGAEPLLREALEAERSEVVTAPEARGGGGNGAAPAPRRPALLSEKALGKMPARGVPHSSDESELRAVLATAADADDLGMTVALQAAEEVEAAMMLRVTRPPDSPIGSQIVVQDPSGRQFRARIPPGVAKGSDFLVRLQTAAPAALAVEPFELEIARRFAAETSAEAAEEARAEAAGGVDETLLLAVVEAAEAAEAKKVAAAAEAEEAAAVEEEVRRVAAAAEAEEAAALVDLQVAAAQGTRLYWAAARGDDLQPHLKGGSPVNWQMPAESAMERARTPLFIASKKGRADAVRQLLQAGASVDTQPTASGRRPCDALAAAAAAGHAKCVKLLLDAQVRTRATRCESCGPSAGSASRSERFGPLSRRPLPPLLTRPRARPRHRSRRPQYSRSRSHSPRSSPTSLRRYLPTRYSGSS